MIHRRARAGRPRLRILIPESPLFLLRPPHRASEAVSRGGGRAHERTPRQRAEPLAGRPIARDTEIRRLDLPPGPPAALGADPGRLAARVGLILRRLRLAAGAAGGQGFGFLRGEAFLVLVALAQLPGYALAAYGVERWGRRPTLIAFLLLSAFGCLAFGIGSSVGFLAAATLLMSFALLGTWGALYAFTPELYPRNSAPPAWAAPARRPAWGACGAVRAGPAPCWRAASTSRSCLRGAARARCRAHAADRGRDPADAARVTLVL